MTTATATTPRTPPKAPPEAATSGKYDVQAIKREAGRHGWKRIFSHLGIPAEILDGRKEHPCPKCGGTTRFRMLDEEAGALYCNHCFSEKNGDGIAAIMWWLGCGFSEALKTLAEYLGIPANGKKKSPKGKAAEKHPMDQIEFVNPAVEEKVITQWLETDRAKGITLAAIKQAGGRAVRWRGIRCLAFFGWKSPYSAVSGKPDAVVLLKIDGKEFEPAGKLGQRKTHLVGGSKNAWVFSRRPKDAPKRDTIVKCEGITDMLMLSADVPDHVAVVTNTNGAQATSGLDYSFAAGVQVYVVGDRDQAGKKGAQRHAAKFFKAGASEVRLIELPFPMEENHGKDLRDYLDEGHGYDDLAKLAGEPVTEAQVKAWASKSEDGRPRILVTPDEPAIISAAIEALSREQNLFQRGGLLVHIVTDAPPPKGIERPKDSPRITAIKPARLQEIMSATAYWLQPAGEDDPKPCHPPAWAVKGVDARGQWPAVPRLEGLAEVPVLRADGSVLQSPGFDEETGLLYRPTIEFPPIPKKPTIDDARRGLKLLLDILHDFPFAKPAHRAAAVAAILTPLSRFAFHGAAPMSAIDANTRGTGKTLLVDTISTTVSGREMPKMTLPRDDDELRKRITALAISCEPLILLDNAPGMIGSPSLDAALTATSWSDRVLGKTEMASGVPLTATWYCTGNNLIFAADTARRALHVRLETDMENPEERTGFRHPKLKQHITEHRAELAAGAVTIMAAYCAAGRPDMGLPPWGSFEAWSDLVRQAIVWAGLDDPGETRQELSTQADREAAALRQLIVAWDEADPSGSGMTASEALRMIQDHHHDYESLQAAIGELVYTPAGKTPSARSLGMKLHHLRRRVIGGKTFDKKDTNQGAAWYVRSVENGGTSRTKDTTYTPSRCRYEGNNNHSIYKGVENSPFTLSSPTASGNDQCNHTWVDEPTEDGRVRRVCSTCGKFFGYVKQEF